MAHERLLWLPHGDKHAARVLLALAALALAAFLLTLPLPRVDGMLIGSDGIGYYMYTRSIALDGDLHFANEYGALYPGIALDGLRTPTGHIANHYAIGPGLLWLPFFLAAHGLALALAAAGLPVATDGYGPLYQAAIAIGSIVYGSLGMALTYGATRRLFPGTALAACAILWLATNIIYYMVIEPSMSHMCSLFATSLLFAVWMGGRPEPTWARCLAVGAAGGLVALVRQPDVTLLLVPVLDYLLLRRPLLAHARALALVGAGFGAVFWVQLLAWQTLNGSPLVSGYLASGAWGFNWRSPRLLEVLGSTEHGLLLWHPVLLFALAGLALMLRDDLRLGLLLWLGFLSQAYLIAAWSFWSQGDAFGGRMFIASTPIFALGLAALLQRAAGLRRPAPLVPVAALLLIGWNALFLIQYRTGYISMSGPYTLRELTIGKLEMAADLVRRLLA